MSKYTVGFKVVVDYEEFEQNLGKLQYMDLQEERGYLYLVQDEDWGWLLTDYLESPNSDFTTGITPYEWDLAIRPYLGEA